MHKVWKIHRPLSRINCVEVGCDEGAFTSGIQVQEAPSGCNVRLRDWQKGYEQEVCVAKECAADGRLYKAREEKRFRAKCDALVRFSALTGHLPFGQVMHEPIIPGGIRYCPGDERRSPWAQAGPSSSYSKEQLFLLQAGDRVVFGSCTRLEERVATLVCHENCLVLRYPTEAELKVFCCEQELWGKAWQQAMDINNPHY